MNEEKPIEEKTEKLEDIEKKKKIIKELVNPRATTKELTEIIMSCEDKVKDIVGFINAIPNDIDKTVVLQVIFVNILFNTDLNGYSGVGALEWVKNQYITALQYTYF